ncbi:hypothetical protein J7943_13410 [Vibrio parahaemolyticus]|uniref:hypothetical protein n=2 Tax=Vibrio parahaemolyticus TaxID=670 RepID=UPI001DB5751E|nr:hypothetical protein [Vibrio parahaemolyticus]EJG1946636.1 hypothetical protein [Vibrio parahaemolyticus]EJG1955968.1 hypothetical protein [Vibrio parahaemolyticus]EKD7366437.1 hypothetical protein [Vibrio parahaemolyticus]MCF9642896.1 hypothetical protein [Vibrio parahaemolyticus]MCF9742813.1 hypothetical protein [Vibrio parahaemolyticus]
MMECHKYMNNLTREEVIRRIRNGLTKEKIEIMSKHLSNFDANDYLKNKAKALQMNNARNISAKEAYQVYLETKEKLGI